MQTESVHAVGRRKTAVARVYLKAGKGDVFINEKPIDEYFGGLPTKSKIYKPLDVTGNKGKIDIQANVKGGGPIGQVEAVTHGVSRALLKLNPELRAALKKEGLLTRDSRIKERKKYGQRGARARYQYSKR